MSDGSKNFCYLLFVKPKNLRLLKVFCVPIFVNSACPSGSTVLDSWVHCWVKNVDAGWTLVSIDSISKNKFVPKINKLMSTWLSFHHCIRFSRPFYFYFVYFPSYFLDLITNETVRAVVQNVTNFFMIIELTYCNLCITKVIPSINSCESNIIIIIKKCSLKKLWNKITSILFFH